MGLIETIIIAVVTGIVGFILGNIKFHREEKYKAYREFLSPIVRFVFAKDNQDAYNEAQQKLWVFASKKVAKKMDIVASRVIKSERGNVIEALQELIAEMRNDIQLWSCSRIKAPEIYHIYTTVQKGTQTEINDEGARTMEDNKKYYSSNHAAQYTNIAADMRFLADQRFKIVTVSLITNGLLLNVAKDHKSMILAGIGLVLSYLCLSWDIGTTRWWGTLIKIAQDLEDIGIDKKELIPVYKKYLNQIPETGLNKLPHLKPSHVVAAIYGLGLVGWGLFLCYSWKTWW
jgi:hypothetical protein